ncbi:MAG: hypothetical protein IH623_30205 [Verrucomicrobia bacterium]|nr:hypothetical protein [Verrucomicrobiota bacterium]
MISLRHGSYPDDLRPEFLLVSIRWLLFAAALLACSSEVRVSGNELWNAGFLYDHFPLTKEAGWRTEAIGPLFYHQMREADRMVALPPLFSDTRGVETDFHEFDLLYPLMTYDRFGSEYRWQLFQVLSIAGGQTQDEIAKSRFTVFPIYFQQRSPDPALNYTALLPVYGHLKNRLFRSEIDFVLWPLYVKSVRRTAASPLPDAMAAALSGQFLNPQPGDVTTYNYLYPIFHLRYGDGLKGWQFWPLVGHEHKEVTTFTNTWGDEQMIPGHDKWLALWPLFAHQERGIGTDNPERQQFLLPFYNYLRSPRRDFTSYLWPFGLTITEDREKKYREVGAPWPFIVFARGEGKTVSRVWPFFSQAQTDSLQSDFFLWPLYKYNRRHVGAWDRDRTRILFILFSDVNEQNFETGRTRQRTDLWPLFIWQQEFDGSRRLQILAPLEPVLPNRKSIERNWSPLWSLWRAEQNPQAGTASQSLLWNLYRRESTPATRKCSLLFGLFQYESNVATRRWRVFYVPFGSQKQAPLAGAD